MPRFVHARPIFAALLAALPLAPRVSAQSDLCQDATPLPIGIANGNTASATLDGAAVCGQSRTRDVWYSFTPAVAGVLVLDSCNSNSNSAVSVHSGCPGTVANQIGCNYFDSYACGGSSHLEVNVAAGNTYLVRIAGNGAPYTFATFFLPPKDPVAVGPDIVSGDIPETRYYGSANGFSAYAMGTSACNIGTADAIWTNANNSNHHPVISTSMYRMKDGRLEQLGYAWLKHGWAAGTETWCDYCPLDAVLDHLVPGCTDSYDVPQNATQSGLGPRSQVNPTTGAFPYPPNTNFPIDDTTSRRIRVATADVDPAQNPGARYFEELQYVAADDALFGNALNNASYREVTIPSVGASPRFVGQTQRTRPAILAWADNDPEVIVSPADFLDGNYVCRFWIAGKAHNNGDGTWTYSYAVFNLNANRAASTFALPLFDGVTPQNPGFSAPLAHSGEPYSNTPWVWSAHNQLMGWHSAQTYAQNPNANALRWGTMYSMWFTAARPPVVAAARLGLFMPGGAGAPTELGAAVPVPSSPCAADFNGDGFVDFLDFGAFVDCFDGLECPANKSADLNADGFVDFFDFNDFVDAFTAGC